MSVVVDWIENFLEDYFGMTFETQYAMLTLGYTISYFWQVFVYALDAISIIFGNREITKFDNIGFLISFFLFSAVYGVIFMIIEPEHKRWFAFLGILASVQLLISTVYYFYVYVSTDIYDDHQLLYYTNMMAPISMLYLTVLVFISILVMCKMSFFRSAKKVLSDLYEVEEKGGKKTV